MLNQSILTQSRQNLRALSGAAQNFGLTLTEFTRLREDLIDGDHRIFEQVFLAHFAECVAYLCQQDKAEEADAYDATMTALLAFRERLVAGKIKYGNLRFLLTRMARQQYWRNTRQNNKHTVITDRELDLISEETPFPEEDERILRRAFKSLGPACQELLRSFYFDRKSLKAIAAEQDRNPAAVRQQKGRCVITLKNLFAKQS